MNRDIYYNNLIEEAQRLDETSAPLWTKNYLLSAKKWTELVSMPFRYIKNLPKRIANDHINRDNSLYLKNNTINDVFLATNDEMSSRLASMRE